MALRQMGGHSIPGLCSSRRGFEPLGNTAAIHSTPSQPKSTESTEFRPFHNLRYPLYSLWLRFILHHGRRCDIQRNLTNSTIIFLLKTIHLSSIRPVWLGHDTATTQQVRNFTSNLDHPLSLLCPLYNTAISHYSLSSSFFLFISLLFHLRFASVIGWGFIYLSVWDRLLGLGSAAAVGWFGRSAFDLGFWVPFIAFLFCFSFVRACTLRILTAYGFFYPSLRTIVFSSPCWYMIPRYLYISYRWSFFDHR